MCDLSDQQVFVSRKFEVNPWSAYAWHYGGVCCVMYVLGLLAQFFSETFYWNQLPAEALGTFLCKPKIFWNRVKKAVINGVKWKE